MPASAYPGEPADPATKDCDWCDRKAVKAFELWKPRKKMGLAQYMYACSRHTSNAERVVAQKREPKTAA